jgi:hypothetical protein
MAVTFKNFSPNDFSLSRNLPGRLFSYGKSGINALFNSQKNAKSQNASTLSTRDRSTANISARSQVIAQSKVNATRVVTQKGNALQVQAQENIQTSSQARSRTELAESTQKLTAGVVNGKQVYSNTERDLRQVAEETRNADSNLSRTGTSLITRNAQKTGNTSQASTHYDNTSDSALNANSQLNRKTDTETQYKTYDQNGKLTGSSFNRQAVTVEQKAALFQTAHAEGTRDIDQRTTVLDYRDGNATTRMVHAETTDAAQGKQTINTQSNTNTATLVEKLDADGNVLAANNYSQQVVSNAERTIDTNRVTNSEQNTMAFSKPGQTETITSGQFETNATTIDQTKTATNVQNFNAAGAVVGERNYVSDVTATTVEKRDGDNMTRTAVDQNKNGESKATTEISAREKADINSQYVYNQDGAVTTRTIDNKAMVQTMGEIDNHVTGNGDRLININTSQVRDTETRDLTAGPTGQGRLVETASQSIQSIDGKMKFDPATNQVGSAQAPGKITVDFGSFTGLRSSFKLDNGTLKFDFTAHKLSSTAQDITTGKVAGGVEPTVAGATTSQLKETYEDIHFTGEVTSTIDDQGNRVISLHADVTDEGIGGLFVNNLQGFQAERSKSEMEIDGKLTVNRETAVNGNQTTTTTTTNAEMAINKVENKEDLGVNVRTLTPLNTDDGFRAGLAVNNGALRFNFGVFNLGISFSA